MIHVVFQVGGRRVGSLQENRGALFDESRWIEIDALRTPDWGKREQQSRGTGQGKKGSRNWKRDISF
jgi:hypothetical protein